MGLEGPEMLKQRVAFLEDLLEKERSRHESHLREISSAAGCREARAMSLCASWRGATLDSSGSEQANIGPGAGVSPNDAESRRPPQGAQDPPPASKLDRWVKRAKTPGESPPEGTSPSTAPKSKLDRWLAKSKTGQDPSPPTEGVTKLDRWLTKSKKPEGAESPSAQASAALEGQWAGEASAFSFEQQDELMVRIREALTAMDAAFELVERAKAEDPSPVGDRKKECPLCSKAEASEEVAGPRPEGGARHSEGTQMGLRVAEKGRGLTVTHVVPGGLGGMSGLQVGDIVRSVNAGKVRSLKRFAGAVKEHAGGVVCLELIRGSGATHQNLTLYARTRAVEEGGEGEEGGSFEQGVLLEQFERENKGGRIPQVVGGMMFPSPSASGRKLPTNKKFNKYGKDTKLWMPESDESVAEIPGNKPNVRAETGGFFMFPPGHPDYVPLPPGEAALIAGRSDVHPNERLAPHWSHIIFTSGSGAEIRAQARHATYGTIEEVSGPMVLTAPVTAHSDLDNAAAVAGTVAYIQRGGAPFTKKARVAVAAGAVACVVANSDKETFGMSFTDDGLPFDALNIPCVMISSDIADKLECAKDWSVTLVPAKPEQQGTKKPPPASSMSRSADRQPTAKEGGAAGEEPTSPQQPLKGMEGLAALRASGLEGLATLPINPKVADLGRPGKKPTMWKKIKLFLP